MLVSIIIPARNAEKTIAECIEACLRQTHPETEVIVVDDGSTDATGRIAQTFPIHYLRQEPRGPAAARNCGARHAKGEYLAFTDADCVPHADWIARLLAASAPGVAGVGGTYGIANPESWLARMVHEEIALRHAGFGEEVDFLGSFNVMYRPEAFEAVGGFDERFTAASAEDNDLAYRLADAGGVLRFAKDAVVAHYHPTRLIGYLRTQMRHGYWRVGLYRKHPRRARSGDRYAGRADLMAPALPGLAFVLAMAGVCAKHSPVVSSALLGMSAVVAGCYIGSRLPLVTRLARRTRDWRVLPFTGVVALRDAARGLGMVAGVCRFWLLPWGRR